MSQGTLTPKQATIDIHIHLAGTGCCHSGIWMSPKLRRRYTIKLMQFIHGISEKKLDDDFDVFWLKQIHNLVSGSREIDFAVLLGFDGAFAEKTKTPDWDKSQLIIPCDWVFNAAKNYPYFLPGPSINPMRADALDLLDYCLEKKAVLIKWIPSAQGINPANQNFKAFFKKAAESQIPLLIHVGGEKTFMSHFPEYNRAENLKFALDEGVKIIAAHSGTHVWRSKEPDDLPVVIKLLEKYPNLWLDNSGLANPSRFHHLPKLAQVHPLIGQRMLYGSDYPVPSDAYYYPIKLGIPKMLKVQKIRNQLDRDVVLKRTFGFAEETLTRAHQVLINVPYWLDFHRRNLSLIRYHAEKRHGRVSSGMRGI